MPTQSVTDGQVVIKEELKQAHTKAEGIFKKDLTAINAGLAKAKLKPLNVIDKAEWEKQNGQGAPAVIKPSWQEMVREAMKMERD
jgi:hypothetical protein